MKATVTGSGGLIGGVLRKRLEELGWETHSYLRPDSDFVFLFGAPSSTIQFDKDMDHCFSSTINNFIDAISYCKEKGIKLIYPSSATVQNKNTPYARCKACLEEIQQAYDAKVLGLRIFAGYGEGEGHKREYASVVYQFTKQMLAGERPVVFGDGGQTRDFIYVNDVADFILGHLDETGVVDIGTGVNTSFLEVVETINKVIGSNIEPIFVDKPIKYVENTICAHPIKNFTPLSEGIRRIRDKVVSG